MPSWKQTKQVATYVEKVPALALDWSIFMQMRSPNLQFDWSKSTDWLDSHVLIGRYGAIWGSEDAKDRVAEQLGLKTRLFPDGKFARPLSTALLASGDESGPS